MNSLVTRILLILIITIIIVINSTIWFLWQLDLNDYRSQLATMVARQTGWRLEFSGKIEHHFVTQGFWLLIKDLQIIDPKGQFIDIEWLKTKVSVDRLFDRHIVLENLEVAVRSCDVELRPEITPPLPIVLNMNATSLNLTAKDCHVYDVESTVETVINDVTINAAPMPILLDGWVVAGMPSGIMSAKQSGTMQATAVAFGNMLGLRQLKLNFVNDHGLISINDLTTELQPPDPQKPSLISPRVTINTKIKLGFNETREELFRTLWKGVDDVWLKPLQLYSENIELETTNNPIQIQNLQIDSDGLPLLVNQNAPLMWLYNSSNHININPQLTTITGSTLSYNNFSINNYLLTTKIQPGVLQAELKRGIVNFLFSQSIINNEKIAEDIIHNITFNAGGKIHLNFNGIENNGSPTEFILKQLQITAQQMEFSQPMSNYNLDTGELEINNLPLIHKGISIEPDLHKAFFQVATAKPTARLNMQNLKHKDAVAESLDLELTIDDKTLNLSRLKIGVANTKLTGNGKWKLSDPTLPWSLQFNSTGLAIEPLLNLLDVPLPIQGLMSVDLKLNSLGKLNTLLPSLNGTLKMTGRDLKILSADINAILTHLESSRGVGLLDLGAYIMLGPAGILLTKGTQYSVLLGSVIAKGNSEVKAMNSTFKITSGTINTEDVALSTSKHRVALAGTLDLRERGVADLQIATVDNKGCAKYMENIGGTGRNPQVSGTGVVINSVLNPVNSLVGTIIGPMIGGCFVPFYSGQVPPPPLN